MNPTEKAWAALSPKERQQQLDKLAAWQRAQIAALKRYKLSKAAAIAGRHP